MDENFIHFENVRKDYMTLACLYLGYRLWGFGGMILSPMLGSIAMELARN